MAQLEKSKDSKPGIAPWILDELLVLSWRAGKER
jgi:hypothetical protein